MLPPDLAAFTFHVDPAGGDAALAARTLAAIGSTGPGAGRVAGRVAVVGAQRWRLLVELARGGAAVVAMDASRAALEMAKAAAEDAGVGDRVTLLATDPRDAEAPGGVDAALVPSAMWRILLHEEAQVRALASLRRILVARGALLLDVDRVPEIGGAPGAWTHLRDGPGRQVWSVRRGAGIVSIRCESPGVDAVPLDLAATSPEETVEAVRRAGFRVESAADPSDGSAFGPSARRLWLVARKDGA